MLTLISSMGDLRLKSMLYDHLNNYIHLSCKDITRTTKILKNYKNNIAGDLGVKVNEFIQCLRILK